MIPSFFLRTKPETRYFPLPNEIFSQGLCASEFAILAYLFRRMSLKLAPPNLMTVKVNLGVSRNTLKKYVRRLQERGLIALEHRSRFLPGIVSVRDTIMLTDALRLRVGHFFPLPSIAFGFGLTVGELAVYGYLLYRENRETYECWPSCRTIGDALHMSRNTVRKYVHRLEEKGYITTEPTTVRRMDGTKWNGNLKFRIRPVRELIEEWNEQETTLAEREYQRQRAARIAERHPELSVTVRPAGQRQTCQGFHTSR